MDLSERWHIGLFLSFCSMRCLLFGAVLLAFTLPLQASGYGTSSPVSSDEKKPFAASPRYMPPVILNDETRNISIDSYIRYIEDARKELDIQDLVAMPNQALSKNENGPFNVGYSESAFWIKIPLYYKGTQENKLFLMELDVPLLDKADLYQVDANGKVRNSTAAEYDTPLSERPVHYPSIVFPLELGQGEKLTLFLRVESDYSLHVPLRIFTPLGFAEHVSIVELLHGIYIGCLLIMIAYNVFVFVSVREKAYFFYVFYIAAYLFFTITEAVHGLQIFGDIPALMHKQYLPVYIWIPWIGAFIMGRYFLNIPRVMKGMDTIVRLVIHVSVVSLIISLFADTTATIRWAVFAPFVLTLTISYFGYVAMSRGVHGANLFCLAWVLNFAGAVVYGMTVAGYLPYNLFTGSALQLGVVCQLIFISFALADRIKKAQKLALKANARALLHLQRYQSLFDNAVEGVYQMSLDRRFIEVNPSMANLLGYPSPARMIEAVPDGIRACYLYEADRSLVIRTLESGRNLGAIEACYQNRQGELRWAQSQIQIIYDENGDPSHLEGTFVDTTEKKEKENYEKEREQDRMQRQLAEASASAKSQFLANMSHEIRTPLTAIIGYGESLLGGGLTRQERKKSAETVVRSGRHLLELINDILDHSKIDANKLEVEIMPVPLLEIMSEVKAYFEPKASKKRLEFSIHYDFPLPEQIRTDPTRLKQILINLCGNALKFTDRGSIQIRVCCDREKEMLFVKVLDTGIGLKPEQMSRLFDPFAQASPSIAREYGGTGLGLNISKKLAEMLGGTIRAFSTYGRGSEFEVSVSTGKLEHGRFLQDSSELSDSQNPVCIEAAPRLSGRILYAEDNEVNRRLIDLLVSKTGADIKMVANGAEALKVATEEQFDLILMDIQMPVMDGRDATQAIRKSGNRTPIAALTANVMAEDIQEYREAGCEECLSKPVDKKSFYDVLSRYLKVVDQQDDTHSGSAAPRFSGRVLVAEDNQENRDLMNHYLTRVGVTPVLAANGKVAVQKALSEHVDLIFMDHHMPEMDGPDAITLLRQAGYRRPIYSFTASDLKEDLESLAKSGSDGVLAKPVDRNRLYRLLGKYLVNESDSDQSRSNQPGSNQDKTARSDAEEKELKEIRDQFVHSLPDRVRTLRADADRGEWSGVKKTAHQLKGVGGSLGFPVLTEKAKRLEMAIKQDKVDCYHELLDILVDESEKTVDSYNC